MEYEKEHYKSLPRNSLRSKRFRLVSEQRNTEEGEMKGDPKSAPLFSRSLTLVPRSFLLNRTETLATQANLGSTFLRHFRSGAVRGLKPSLLTVHGGEGEGAGEGEGVAR